MHRLLVLACSWALAACGSSSSARDAAVVQDLPSTTGDLAVPQSCAQVYACTTGCSTSVCIGTCAAGGTSSAQQSFGALYACAYAQCLPNDAGGDFDGGAGSCASTTDSSASCTACLHSAELVPACSTQLASCESG